MAPSLQKPSVKLIEKEKVESSSFEYRINEAAMAHDQRRCKELR